MTADMRSRRAIDAALRRGRSGSRCWCAAARKAPAGACIAEGMMIFRVRDLMVNVLPDTGTRPDDLLMCTQMTTPPKPAPAPKPKPKPGPKHAEIADEGA